MERKAYPSDVTDDEWVFVAPYMTLMTEEASQRTHSLRKVFNSLRCIVRAGSPWRMTPNDLPSREAVYHVYPTDPALTEGGCLGGDCT